MTFQEFKEAVEEFAAYNCQDYFQEYSLEFLNAEDQGDHAATITITLPDQSVWVVPVIVGECGEIGIQAYDCFTVGLDREGLFTWLFFEAEKRLREVKK